MKTRTLDLTFAALLIITVIMWQIGERGGHGPLVAGILLLLAGIKGWWVADEFMGLRHSAMHWRLILLLWLLVVVLGIGIAYFLSLS